MKRRGCQNLGGPRQFQLFKFEMFFYLAYFRDVNPQIHISEHYLLHVCTIIVSQTAFQIHTTDLTLSCRLAGMRDQTVAIQRTDLSLVDYYFTPQTLCALGVY